MKEEEERALLTAFTGKLSSDSQQSLTGWFSGNIEVCLN